jgi:hypothetical protein
VTSRKSQRDFFGQAACKQVQSAWGAVLEGELAVICLVTFLQHFLVTAFVSKKHPVNLS